MNMKTMRRDTLALINASIELVWKMRKETGEDDWSTDSYTLVDSTYERLLEARSLIEDVPKKPDMGDPKKPSKGKKND